MTKRNAVAGDILRRIQDLNTYVNQIGMAISGCMDGIDELRKQLRILEKEYRGLITGGKRRIKANRRKKT